MPFSKLSSLLQSGLAQGLGWSELRPAQPLILEELETSNNILVMGPSGCGKSTAAIIGILDGLLKSRGSSPAALLLTDNEPTIAWTSSLCSAAGLLACSARSEVENRSGDTPDVLFLSPGDLESQLTRDRDWSTLRWVVLDELSTHLPGYRGAHLNVVLERLYRACGSDPQRVALSSSVGDPDVVLSWSCGSSRRPSRVLRVPGAAGRRLLEVERVAPGMDVAEVTSVKVRGRGALVQVDSTAALQELRAGLERRGLRCQGETRDCAVELGSEPTEHRFFQVISLTPPGSVKDLLATVALTPREAKTVSRVCLATRTDEDFLAACAAVSLAERRWVEPVGPSRGVWPVYLQQLIGRILACNGVTLEQALRDDNPSWALRDLSPEERQRVVEHLVAQEVLEHAAGHLVLGRRGEAAFEHPQWRQTGKGFARPERFVVIMAQGEQIGTVDSWFLDAFSPFRFILGDRLWHIADIRPSAGKAVATAASLAAGVHWSGPLRVYHPHLCEEIRALLLSDAAPGFLKPRQLDALQRLRERWRHLLSQRQDSQLLSFAGARVNALIAKLHHVRTGEGVVFNNLLVETRNGSGLEATLARFESGLSAEEEASLVVDCQENAFLDLLPPEQKAAHLIAHLFDREGTCKLASSVLSAELASKVRDETAPYSGEEFPSGDVFFQQLVQLARTETTRNKWIFVPEPGLKWILSERLLHSGVDWVNFRFQTPFQMALEVAAPHLVAAGVDPKPEGLGPDLLMKLLLQLPVEGGYFRPLADQPGVAKPLWKAVTELRVAGLSSTDLRPELFSTPAKGREIKALLEAYEAYLASHRLGDKATVFRTALQHIDDAPVAACDLTLEYPAEPWSALERRFLDSLRGAATATWVTESDRPRRWSLLCSQSELRPRVVGRDCYLLAQLSSTQRAPARHDESLRFFCAGRRDAEIQEVLRRIRDRGTALDQIEIAVHDPDSLALLWDKLSKHGLPASLQDGIPVSATTPGRAVLGLLQWSESNFSSFFLRELLMAGLLQMEGDCPSSTGARYLERAKATWGRSTYALHLGQLEARYRYQAEARDRPPEEKQAQATRADNVALFAGWVESLLSRWPETTANGEHPLALLLDGLLEILQRDIPLRGHLDRLASASIKRALRDLRLLSETSWTHHQCHRLIREKLEGLTVGAGRPEPGKLFVTNPFKIGRSGRSHHFLLGLEAGSLSANTSEDAILGDEERQKLHDSLELSTDRVVENQFRLYQQLGRLDGEVTLSYSCRDFRSGEELLPSRLFFDAARLLYPAAEDYEQLAKALGEPISLAPAAPEQAAGDAEWWLAKLVGCGKESELTVLTGFPWLWRGREAQVQRESLLFTAFEGYVPQAAGLYDPRTAAFPISVSRLQQLAECPFRTFLKTVLGIRPLELEQPDYDRWLKATERGTALHETFAAYYRELRAAGARPAPGDLGKLNSLLEGELDKLRQVLPPPSPTVEGREREQLHRDLANFLKLELAAAREVVACEVGFGMPDTFDEPLARRDPVVIDLGDDLRFPLHGRIDRIDRVDGGYEVIDYKTGYQLTGERNPRYCQGQILQHALYALVAETLLDGPVCASSYYFPATHAKKVRVPFTYPDKVELSEVLRLVLEPLQTGAFAHTVQSSKHCGHCDFRAACIAQNDKLMLTKYEQPENSLLGCRSRLRSVR